MKYPLVSKGLEDGSGLLVGVVVDNADFDSVLADVPQARFQVGFVVSDRDDCNHSEVVRWVFSMNLFLATEHQRCLWGFHRPHFDSKYFRFLSKMANFSFSPSESKVAER